MVALGYVHLIIWEVQNILHHKQTYAVREDEPWPRIKQVLFSWPWPCEATCEATCTKRSQQSKYWEEISPFFPLTLFFLCFLLKKYTGTSILRPLKLPNRALQPWLPVWRAGRKENQAAQMNQRLIRLDPSRILKDPLKKKKDTFINPQGEITSLHWTHIACICIHHTYTHMLTHNLPLHNFETTQAS